MSCSLLEASFWGYYVYYKVSGCYFRIMKQKNASKSFLSLEMNFHSFFTQFHSHKNFARKLLDFIRFEFYFVYTQHKVWQFFVLFSCWFLNYKQKYLVRFSKINMEFCPLLTAENSKAVSIFSRVHSALNFTQKITFWKGTKLRKFVRFSNINLQFLDN